MQPLEDVAAQQAIATAIALDERRQAIDKLAKEMRRRWEPTLSSEVVGELERKSKSGENMSRDELQQWSVAVSLSQPDVRTHLDGDGIRQADDGSVEELHDWYVRPLADSLLARLPSDESSRRREGSTAMRAPSRTAQRQRGTSRSPRSRRSSLKSSTRGDPDPEPPLPSRAEWLRLLRAAIDAARRLRLEQHRECTGCGRDLELDYFRPGRRVCRRCEVASRGDRRAAARVVA